VTTLAARVGVSRATLARRFEAEVGRAPGEYVSALRMDLAARRLRTTDDTVGTVARAVGYRSEYAFNRAFAREYGTPPGAYRRERRNTARPARTRSED
jgi:AraC-like DNA-binding protein